MNNPVVDLIERAGSTAAQVFLATWLTLQAAGGGYDIIALQTAGAAAALSVAKYVVTYKLNITGDNTALRVLERVMWTGVQAFAGAWITLELKGIGWKADFVVKVALSAGLAAMVKNVLALNWGDKTDPALV